MVGLGDTTKESVCPGRDRGQLIGYPRHGQIIGWQTVGQWGQAHSQIMQCWFHLEKGQADYKGPWVSC